MKKLLFVLLIAISVYSCRKTSNISNIPKITFTSLTGIQYSSGKDSIAVLKFEYEDGDGDLGSLSSDSTGYRNLFVKYMIMQNGIYITPTLPVGFDAQIPNLTPKAKNKSISGDITYNLILPPAAVSDTIKFEVYIIDRANHKSNVFETSPLIITTP
ncbi:MAG: hypothetical protein JNK61_07400 [Bacteroidia bacterium]|nr:hypothetical protein [Bacteroidia bacterium]HQV00926.1 hypothetical protein [Bacteroidia bacterium]